ncbi:MAG TPA: hypothetical protein VGB75_11450 [Jatrophihabitans sp.]|uniref:hypothetical protein n=1 Tax=Jatrophihabitans sp. TaxID=1932789 RepID=UPI002F18DCDE
MNGHSESTVFASLDETQFEVDTTWPVHEGIFAENLGGGSDRAEHSQEADSTELGSEVDETFGYRAEADQEAHDLEARDLAYGGEAEHEAHDLEAQDLAYGGEAEHEAHDLAYGGEAEHEAHDFEARDLAYGGEAEREAHDFEARDLAYGEYGGGWTSEQLGEAWANGGHSAALSFQDTAENTGAEHDFAVGEYVGEWSGEMLAEEWAAGGEGFVVGDSNGAVAEFGQEDGGPQVASGQFVLQRHPVLTKHRGTPPDLILRWNTMSKSTSVIDVVIHLHGYSSNGPRMRLADKAAISGLDLAPPGARTGGPTRPILGLVPRGNFFGGGRGDAYNFPELVKPGAILELVGSGLEILRLQTGVSAKLGRLILTGHSGGGAPVNAIVRHTDPDEVHIFDGTYGDMSHVVAWAKRRIARGTADSALRILYRPGSGTAKNALLVANAICGELSASPSSAVLRRLFRVEATSVEHIPMPRTFGWRLLVDPAADLPGATPHTCAHGRSVPAAPSGSRPAAPQPATSTPLPVGGRTQTPDRIAGRVRRGSFSKCATGEQKGAGALRRQWTRLTGRKAGTFNCRSTASGSPSLHGEGRSIDCYAKAAIPSRQPRRRPTSPGSYKMRSNCRSRSSSGTGEFGLGTCALPGGVHTSSTPIPTTSTSI